MLAIFHFLEELLLKFEEKDSQSAKFNYKMQSSNAVGLAGWLAGWLIKCLDKLLLPVVVVVVPLPLCRSNITINHKTYRKDESSLQSVCLIHHESRLVLVFPAGTMNTLSHTHTVHSYVITDHLLILLRTNGAGVNIYICILRVKGMDYECLSA